MWQRCNSDLRASRPNRPTRFANSIASTSNMFGLLKVDKPAGKASRDVLNRVQRLVKPHKVGHAGTLDPLATGVLIVAIGQATRLIEYVQRMSKAYQGVFLLGRTSDTEDVE